MSEINRETIIAAIDQANFTLQPTQIKLCLPIINRIYKKMSNGIKFVDIKVCDTLIIDGHHRYICSLLANIQLDEAKSKTTIATVEYKWTDVEFDEEDWESEENIKNYNILDAEFNNISFETLIEWTK